VILVGFLFAYTAAMFILYTVAPLIYRMASSAFYNISLLTSDFYGLLFGLFLFVRIETNPTVRNFLTYSFYPALCSVLAILPSFCGRDHRFSCLLLVCYAYVLSLRSSNHALTLLHPAEAQGKSDPQAPPYVMTRARRNGITDEEEGVAASPEMQQEQDDRDSLKKA